MHGHGSSTKIFHVRTVRTTTTTTPLPHPPPLPTPFWLKLPPRSKLFLDALFQTTGIVGLVWCVLAAILMCPPWLCFLPMSLLVNSTGSLLVHPFSANVSGVEPPPPGVHMASFCCVVGLCGFSEGCGARAWTGSW